MNLLRDIYLHERLRRADEGRHRRTRAPGDEGPRRRLGRAAAGLAGRALVALGARLLRYSGDRTRALADLAHHTPPPTFSRN
jgi:hypothetical protein